MILSKLNVDITQAADAKMDWQGAGSDKKDKNKISVAYGRSNNSNEDMAKIWKACHEKFGYPNKVQLQRTNSEGWVLGWYDTPTNKTVTIGKWLREQVDMA